MSGILFDQYQERLRRLRASGSALKNHARTAALFQGAGLNCETVTDIEIEEWLLGLPVNDRTRELHFQNTSAVRGMGMVASMAAILLQVGDDRVLDANSTFMIHEISSGAQGKLSDLMDAQAYIAKQQDRARTILAWTNGSPPAMIGRFADRCFDASRVSAASISTLAVDPASDDDVLERLH